MQSSHKHVLVHSFMKRTGYLMIIEQLTSWLLIAVESATPRSDNIGSRWLRSITGGPGHMSNTWADTSVDSGVVTTTWSQPLRLAPGQWRGSWSYLINVGNTGWLAHLGRVVPDSSIMTMWPADTSGGSSTTGGRSRLLNWFSCARFWHQIRIFHPEMRRTMKNDFKSNLL